MEWRTIRRSLFRIGGLVGFAITAIRWFLEWYGELDTARSAFENRGPVLDVIGSVLVSSWFGPAVAVASLLAFVAIDHQSNVIRLWRRIRGQAPPVQYRSHVLQQFGEGASSSLRHMNWGDGDSADSRPEYRDWSNVDFVMDGTRKERASAYIEVKKNGDDQPPKVGCIAWSGGWSAELRDMQPDKPYHVEVFLRLKQPTELFIDKGRQHPVGYRPIYTDPGCYVTDDVFLNGTHRGRLQAGRYSFRVIVAIGDVANRRKHESEWKDFVVP